jgi:hypothetical protein
VIEAPLSVCFDSKGNPKGRSIEKEQNRTRYWYVGAGCVVMVAALYLIRDIQVTSGDTLVRLFEGFVSYKNSSPRSNHKADVCALREIVRSPNKFRNSLYSSEQLKMDGSDQLYSALRITGFDCGIPAVIKTP